MKYLILCNPHNPVGRVWTKGELVKLGDLWIKNNIKVIADEIHGDLVLGGKKYIPFASISEEFAKHSITCLSATKTFSIEGLQASTVIFPDKKDYDKFEKILNKLDIKRNNCFSLVAVEAAYRDGEEWLVQLLAYLEENLGFGEEGSGYIRMNVACPRELLKEGLNRIEKALWRVKERRLTKGRIMNL